MTHAIHPTLTPWKADELCDNCSGVGTWETEYETWGDIGHEEHACPDCGGTGLSLLGRIMAGLDKPEPWPVELDDAMAAVPVVLPIAA